MGEPLERGWFARVWADVEAELSDVPLTAIHAYFAEPDRLEDHDPWLATVRAAYRAVAGPVSYGHRLEATYADGLVLVEGDDDANPVIPGRGNFYTAVLNHQAVDAHGRLTRFRLLDDAGVELACVEWDDGCPLDETPVYARRMSTSLTPSGPGEVACEEIYFGWSRADTAEVKTIRVIPY